MNLLRFLFRSARGLTLLTGLAALLSGACNAGLIALVNAILNRPEIPTGIMIWSPVSSASRSPSASTPAPRRTARPTSMSRPATYSTGPARSAPRSRW